MNQNLQRFDLPWAETVVIVIIPCPCDYVGALLAPVDAASFPIRSSRSAQLTLEIKFMSQPTQ